MKLHIRYIHLVFLSLLLVSCNSEEFEVGQAENSIPQIDGILIQPPQIVASRRIRSSDLELFFSINGEAQSSQRTENGSWIVQANIQPGTALNVSIVWSGFGINLATLEHFVASVDTNMQIEFRESDYVLLDDDGDSFSNIDELDNGSDLNDSTSTPNQSVISSFNANQENCLTRDFIRETLDGQQFTTAVTPELATILATPEVQLPVFYEPITLNVGSSVDIDVSVTEDLLVVYDVVRVLEPGNLTIIHLSGAPLDSYAELYERNLNGELGRIAFNDDGGGGGNSLNSVISVDVVPGGYCYIIGHLSLFPISAGGIFDPISLRYQLN